ncbi:rod-binding protein [Gluconobacter cerinus]|uniref:rod-binding protein n=1 Tax=Gluconobacter cerinus TaxID=38307 RepID=UPI001B8C15F8|nr:rod-binding protein [Gluconobacter cerinus]MBS1033592.1 rod-binding protein [Gluconobacter cerinus]
MTVSDLPALSQGYALHDNAPDAAKTLKAARDFESMTINQMLQPMFQSSDDSQSMFSGGAGEQQFRPMLVEQIAKQMENNGGLGMTDAINRQMLAMQEQK